MLFNASTPEDGHTSTPREAGGAFRFEPFS